MKHIQQWMKFEGSLTNVGVTDGLAPRHGLGPRPNQPSADHFLFTRWMTGLGTRLTKARCVPYT